MFYYFDKLANDAYDQIEWLQEQLGLSELDYQDLTDGSHLIELLQKMRNIEIEPETDDEKRCRKVVELARV